MLRFKVNRKRYKCSVLNADNILMNLVSRDAHVIKCTLHTERFLIICIFRFVFNYLSFFIYPNLIDVLKIFDSP